MRRRGSTQSPLAAPSHFLLTGMTSLQQADQSSLPNNGGLGCMPLSSPFASLKCPSRWRWNWEVAGNSFWGDMVVQVGPDGNSPSCVAHLPFWGAETRPTPPVPTFHSLAPLVLPTALSTSQVFCKPQLSKPPTYRALSLGFGRGCLFFIFFWVLSQPSEEAGDLQPQFWQLLQVRIFGSHCLSVRLQVPSGGVIFEVGGQTVLRPCLAVPPLPPPGSMYLAVPTPWVCLHLWLTPDEGAAEPPYLFFQGCHYGKCLLMGLPHISQTSFYWGFPPPPPRGLAPGGWASVGWDLAVISGTLLCFCPLQSLKEETNSSISSGSPGGDRGSLCCLYTLRYKDCISFLLVWGPTSWMAYTSTSGSSFGNSCWWPWPTICSASFCP